MNMKFDRLPADRCILYKRKRTTLALIIVYVDDILFGCNDEGLIKECLDDLEMKFQMKIIRKPKNFLGIEIERDKESKTTKLYQRDYTYRVLERFGMLDSHAKMTPMETNLQIEKTGIRNEDTEVRSLIGALLYLSRNTRPDISFTVNHISRFQSESTPQILIYGKRILRYLKGTINMRLIFDSKGQRAVTAFVDVSFASAKEDQLQSTTGFLIYTFGDLIDWETKKQSRSMTSTAAAEFVAINDTLKEIMFIRSLNEKILNIREATLFEDNSSAISIANGTESSEGRFLLTKYYAIKQAVEENEIQVQSVPGTFQIADIMTKAVDGSTFQRLRPFIVRKITNQDKDQQNSISFETEKNN